MTIYAKKQRAKVRRHSRLAETEHTFWQAYPGNNLSECRRWFRRVQDAAKAYTRKHKGKGQRHGGLGYVALEILEELARLADYKTGRLDPSYKYLAARLNRSIDAISRGLKQLREHGFIDWIRRFVQTTDAEGRLINVQTSNAYRVFLPPAAEKLLGRFIKPVPIPEDALQRKRDLDEWRKLQLAALNYEEQCELKFGVDDPLGRAFAKLGNAIGKRDASRDSAKRSEPMS